ncbi:hypothetical protein C8A03DRAFT_17421 [Achaetomium macrosporum]|uniref:Uncharacterized protein n=1 Tax=Achaetomium macrosporum TaxID=79813 RepID=A0AAN7C5P2_9PEZI|nr:hypothetical protein C8A03DRAFT_17421 [Achaetomium macrosporum]
MAHHSPSTCLSDRAHENRVSDRPAVHINRCLPAAKQRRFYDSLPPESQQRITRVNGKILELRQRLDSTPNGSTAGARLKDFKRAMGQWSAATGRHAYASDTTRAKSGSGSWRSRTPGTPQLRGTDDLDSVDRRVKASAIYFKDGQPYDIPGLPKSFPHQKLSVADLLSENEAANPILQPAEDGVTRYFHLPANNMVWVEEIIARYYHEKRPQSDGLRHKSATRRPESRAENVLQPGYWKGQQNFDGDSEVHARHMRPFCSGIPVDAVASEPNPRNLVLFMPYLHWETDRGREKSAEIAKNASTQHLLSVSEVVDQAKHQFPRTETRETMAPGWELQPAPSVGGNLDRKKALGQVLRAAAALLEAMDLHTEEELMMKYLHADPPLHPRRTLDQAYYGALRSTHARDKDQVVYRGTTPQPHECIGMGACPQCNEDIRKTPRIIMVDQLWMWILDEKTVITSFPRHWGRNRADPTAIHKSLRMRLQYARPGEISSAYDLALVIVDEASRVFFDRTKTNQKQPNLVELFNSAIRDLTYKQTAAFNQFLIYTHLASRDYKRQHSASFDNSNQNHLLNINPEGELLKEVKDIMDELHIMMRIQEQQQTVMESFVKHIRRALTPLVRPSKLPTTSQASAAWDLTLGASLEGASPYADESTLLHEGQQRQNAQRTLLRAENLLLDHSERISELQTLLKNAQTTSAALKDLLTLKQQQAGVIEAREAVKQAQLTLKQGQSIMIFTIVTIIFLPLSFFASVFGMNAVEINGAGSQIPLATEFRLMFAVSAGIILVSFLFAFSRTVRTNSAVALARSAVAFVWNTGVTWVLVKTGLYVLGREMAVRAKLLRDREGKITGAMKAEVLRREKNLERMRAAGHVRELAARRRGNGRASVDNGVGNRDGAGGAGSPGRVFSPFSTASIPGSPSPFLAAQRKGTAVESSEVDVELGERVSRKPSSQMHLAPGRQDY